VCRCSDHLASTTPQRAQSTLKFGWSYQQFGTRRTELLGSPTKSPCNGKQDLARSPAGGRCGGRPEGRSWGVLGPTGGGPPGRGGAGFLFFCGGGWPWGRDPVGGRGSRPGGRVGSPSCGHADHAEVPVHHTEHHRPKSAALGIQVRCAPHACPSDDLMRRLSALVARSRMTPEGLVQAHVRVLRGWGDRGRENGLRRDVVPTRPALVR